VPLEYYESLSDTRKPKIGDLLYTLVGSYGIPVVVDNNRPFCFQRHMALLKPRNIDTYFLWYQMQTNETYDQATNIATGTAQLTVPIKGLRKMKILSPIHNEQLEIVHILDEILLKLRQSRDLAESVIAQIDMMKKAILARAFRGELGTNVPGEAACEG
jgi:type I restriction enzyme S subunit